LFVGRGRAYRTKEGIIIKYFYLRHHCACALRYEGIYSVNPQCYEMEQFHPEGDGDAGGGLGSEDVLSDDVSRECNGGAEMI